MGSQRAIKQTWTPYWEWEDFLSGMWRKLPKEQEPEMLQKAIEFTGNHERYGAAMKAVSIKWPRTMINSLTNPTTNKRAFIGHCACQYVVNLPEYIVREAWWMLTNEQRILADKQAQKYINKWLKKYERKNIILHKTMGGTLLPLWNS